MSPQMSTINIFTSIANAILYNMIYNFQQLSTNIMSYFMSTNISKMREIVISTTAQVRRLAVIDTPKNGGWRGARCEGGVIYRRD